MAVRQHWRDCQAWKENGLLLSTTSNQASQMFDASLTQFVGWYNDKSLGGIAETSKRMLEADPNFVMGRVLSTGLEVLGSAVDSRLKQKVDELVAMAATADITDAERKHVEAVRLMAAGMLPDAVSMWESILVDYPQDMLALKMAHISYFLLASYDRMRDSVARVMPRWNPTMPNNSYLYGMHAFGLEETNLYPTAEASARKGLEMNRKDTWATHALAHTLEMTGRQDEGIDLMGSTVQDWSECDMLASHNYWHWALYYVEKGLYEDALGIFDNEIIPRVKSKGTLGQIVDGASLLHRLKMEGVNVGDRWADVCKAAESHIGDHVNGHYDTHFLMAFLGGKQMEATEKMLQALKDYIREGVGYYRPIARDVTLPVCNALVAYENGDFAEAVNHLYPVRYRIQEFGGSHAQRDIFNLFLIQSALNSSESHHHKLARSLLSERKALKLNAPLTDRLMAKLLACHIE